MTVQADPEAGTHRPFEDAIVAADAFALAEVHQHRDLPGGWLRPAVLSAINGLIANASLIAGVSGGGASAPIVILTGLAGLAAGALSMATGQYVAVSSQNQLIQTEARKVGLELLFHPDTEEKQLTEVFRARGFGDELASTVAQQVSADPVQALTVHVREKFGADHRRLPSPLRAAAASLAIFAAGALIPLLPYLLGYASLAAALALAAIAAFTGGGLAARLTGRPFLRGALRQLLTAAAAAGITYLIGHFTSASI